MIRMRKFLPLLMLAISASASGAIDGHYQGLIEGTPATLQLQSSGNQMQGEIDASGYRYLLQGQTDGNSAQGQLQDPQTGAILPFNLQTAGNEVQLVLMSGAQPLSLVFQRTGGVKSPDSSAAQSGQGASQPGAQIDPRLVGRWRHNDTMISGEASFVSNSYVTFSADGRYLYQDGAAYASGSSAYGSTTIESQAAGGGDTGSWKVQGDQIYTRPDATGQWQLLGRVYIEGNSALLYYPDGSKTLWKRN